MGGAFQLLDRYAAVCLRNSDHVLLRHDVRLQDGVLLDEFLLVVSVKVEGIEVIASTSGLLLLLLHLVD